LITASFISPDQFASIIRIAFAFWASVYSAMQVGPARFGGYLVPSNQFLRPAGSRVEFPGGPTDIAVSPDGAIVALSVSDKVLLYTPAGGLTRTVRLPGVATYGGLVFSADGQMLAASNAAGVSIFAVAAESPVSTVTVPDPIPCGLAFDPLRPYLYVALNRTNQVARIDLEQMSVTATAAVGVAPVGLAVSPAGDSLFVSNWGGRVPASTDLTAPSAGTAVVVDGRGIAASGTVSAISLASFQVIGEVVVGLHPGAIRMRPDGALLAVANANSDSISFVDTDRLTVTGSTAIPAYPQGYAGSSPTALAFNADGSQLFVACAGNNSVIVLALTGGVYQVAGSAPTDWYPVALAISPHEGKSTVFVANAKGVGSRAGGSPYSVSERLGTWSRFTADDMTENSRVSALNNLFDGKLAPRGSPAKLKELGIRHVFLIIKENRTYDQVLGDLGRGNGAPALATYGAQVTPNHHLLASQFVTLDNFYATGVVSADGHQWITQAMATDYVERSHSAAWPRSYPYTGDDPLAFASTGFIWDNALDNGLSVKIFGEFTHAAAPYSQSWTEYLADAQATQMQYATPSRSAVAPVNAIIEPDYPSFALNVPDQFRARIFLDKFQQYVAAGQMPNLVIVWLPSDHTAGITPGYPAPADMVADNDLALGQIVQAISASPYWPASAVLVTEDDAQNGVDHVDGHRTLCLVASPYARRGVVDSTSYNQTSLVRTIEDLLGLAPMNKFDAAALPMESVFQTAPDMTPYLSVSNLTPLARINPPASSLKGKERKAALASLKMDFVHPDAAPESQVNRFLWHAAKGWNVRYPTIPHRPDCKIDDDDGR
jgi:DNA-binding beta-propeller fold protein YncE